MPQEKVWDREYKKPAMLSLEKKPRAEISTFVKFLKKKEEVNVTDLDIIDLGSGTGRNAFYFAEMGNRVTGLEISRTALEIAEKYTKESGLPVRYVKQSIGESFPCKDSSMYVALDILASNSLNEAERSIYLQETYRVLKAGGYFLVHALCKDGDANAKELLKKFPGQEKDTYVMPDIELVERVWKREDFIKEYEKYFTILHLEKKTSYPYVNNRSYKRNFWIAYLRRN